MKIYIFCTKNLPPPTMGNENFWKQIEKERSEKSTQAKSTLKDLLSTVIT